MANDVEIVVTASVADALIKLDLAKHAINDLGDESEQTAAKQAEATAASSAFSDAIAGMNDVLMQSVTIWPGFSAPLIALPVIAFAAATAVVALADAVGTLIAIVADFVAPLTLVTGLLGGLAAGFVIAAKRAAEGGGPFKGFHKQLGDLHDQFDKVSTDLALRFLPYLEQLASAASQALTFIDKLAHEPLDRAMRDMATQGVNMLRRFVNGITAVIAQPIRLAFQIAFGAGPGGNEFKSLVQSWWHRFTGFLFGYTERNPIRLDGRVIQVDRHVDGIFQPLIDWFNRHHFTKQGIQIGHEILAGLLNSGLRARLTAFLVAVFADAARTVARKFVALIGSALTYDMMPLFRMAAHTIIDLFGKAWDAIIRKQDQVGRELGQAIRNAASQAASAIRSALGSAWNWVVSKARSIWSEIVSIFSAPIHISFSFPSIPNPLSLLGGGGSSAPSRGGGGAGQQGHVAGMVIVNHFHSADFTTEAQRERVAQDLSKRITRQMKLRAAGH